VFITPAVAGGQVFVGSCSGKLYALADSTGDVLWTYDTSRDGPPMQFHGDPLLSDNLLVVGTDTDSIGHLYGFERSTGTVVWKHTCAGGFPSQVVSRGATAFAMTGGNEVLAVELASGKMRWRAHGPPDAQPGFNTSDPVISGTRLVVAWRAGWADAFDVESGNVLWRRSLSSPVNTSVYLQADTVAVGTGDGLMHRLRLSDGVELEPVQVEGMPFGDIVSANGFVLLLTKANEIDYLSAWTPDFGRRMWVHQSAKPWSTFRPAVQGNSALVGYPGRLLVVDLTGGTELGGWDVDGSPRGLARHGSASYVGLLEGSVLRLETSQ